MDVAPHPHTGLQTVSWLFDGHITHHDSGENHAVVRPGELGIMTAGAGICHSEVSTSYSEVLHGVQLWTVLPTSDRFTDRRLDHYVPPAVSFAGGTALVFLGSLFGTTSPVTTFTPLLGAEIRLDPGADVDLAVDPAFEHGVLLDAGAIAVEGERMSPSELAHLPLGASTVHVANTGHAPARLLFLGGEPFEEEFIMWWNFIGRTQQEIIWFREEWESSSTQFGQVDGYIGRTSESPTRLPAPHLPHVPLKPRRHRR